MCVPPCSSAFCEQLREDERERRRALAGERHRLELGRHLAAGADALHEHRAQPVEQLGEVDVLVALLGQHLVHGRDREDPVDRVLERLARIDVAGVPRLEPQQRRHGLEVVLDPVVDLLGEHAAHHRAPVLERDRRLLGDRGEQLAVVLGERRVARSATSSPIWRPRQRSGWRIACASARPSGQAIAPSSSTSAAPVAESASIVVFTIASSDSSR